MTVTECVHCGARRERPDLDPPTIVDHAVQTAAALFNVTPDELYGRDRHNRISQARKATIAALRHLHELSYPELGIWFDRHHTTIMHAVDTANPHLTNQLINQLTDHT